MGKNQFFKITFFDAFFLDFVFGFGISLKLLTHYLIGFVSVPEGWKCKISSKSATNFVQFSSLPSLSIFARASIRVHRPWIVDDQVFISETPYYPEYYEGRRRFCVKFINSFLSKIIVKFACTFLLACLHWLGVVHIIFCMSSWIFNVTVPIFFSVNALSEAL